MTTQALRPGTLSIEDFAAWCYAQSESVKRDGRCSIIGQGVIIAPEARDTYAAVLTLMAIAAYNAAKVGVPEPDAEIRLAWEGRKVEP